MVSWILVWADCEPYWNKACCKAHPAHPWQRRVLRMSQCVSSPGARGSEGLYCCQTLPQPVCCEGYEDSFSIAEARSEIGVQELSDSLLSGACAQGKYRSREHRNKAGEGSEGTCAVASRTLTPCLCLEHRWRSARLVLLDSGQWSRCTLATCLGLSSSHKTSRAHPNGQVVEFLDFLGLGQDAQSRPPDA